MKVRSLEKKLSMALEIIAEQKAKLDGFENQGVEIERLKKRHADSVPDSFMEFWFRYAKMCEPAGDDEKNSFNIEITKKMAREDVINQILKFADKV